MTQPVTILDAEIFDPGILDQNNPRSLVSIVPSEIQEYVLRIPRDFFLMREAHLTKLAKPDFTSKCLRIQFWQEYARAQTKRDRMKLDSLIRGITHRDYFLNLARTRPHEFAWICIPPRSYDVMQKQILEESLEKLREAVAVDFYDLKITETTTESGKFTKTTTKKLNANAIAEVRKITEMLQTRVIGSMTHSLAVTHTVEPGKAKVAKQVSIDALSALEERLEELSNTQDAEYIEDAGEPILPSVDPTRYPPVRVNDDDWEDEDL